MYYLVHSKDNTSEENYVASETTKKYNIYMAYPAVLHF